MNCFWNLSTERSFGFYAGPIPYSRIKAYGRDKQLSPEVLELFVHVMQTLDGVFLEDAEDQRKKEQPPATQAPNTKNRRS